MSGLEKENTDLGKHAMAFLDDEPLTPEEEQPETGDTTEDTPPEGDTPEETPDEEGIDATPEPSTFKKLGLDKKYQTEEQALAALVQQEKTITQHQMERQQWESRIARLEGQLSARPAPEPVTIDPDDFAINPQAAIEKLGYVRGDQVAAVAEDVAYDILDRKEANAFVTSKADFEELRPTMDAIARNTRGIGGLSRLAAIEYLYSKARELTGKSSVVPEPIPPTVVNPAPGASTKGNANTSGGTRGGPAKIKSGKGLDAYTPEELEKLPPADIKRIIGYG
jgi:hypothetical protein